MNKYLKPILISFLIISIGLCTFVVYGLYLIDIEDRYGDLQNLYFESKTGDVVINRLNGEVGILQIEKRRMFIEINNKKLHIDEWLDPKNKYIFDVEIYRIDKSRENLKLTQLEINEKINSNKASLVSHLKTKY
jgi:hypothetical protein